MWRHVHFSSDALTCVDVHLIRRVSLREDPCPSPKANKYIILLVVKAWTPQLQLGPPEYILTHFTVGK